MRSYWTILTLAGSIVLTDAGTSSAQWNGWSNGRGILGGYTRGMNTGYSPFGNQFGNQYSGNYRNLYDNLPYNSGYTRGYTTTPYYPGYARSYSTSPSYYTYSRSQYSTVPTYSSPTYYTLPSYTTSTQSYYVSPTYTTTPTYTTSPLSFITPVTSIQSESTPAINQNYATISVIVPTPETQVWLGSTQMNQTGTVRVFHSPALSSGQNYSYAVKARWLVDGRAVEQVQTVAIRAGQSSSADFRSDSSDVVPEPQRIK